MISAMARWFRADGQMRNASHSLLDVAHNLLSPAEFAQFVRAARMGVVATVDDAGNPEAALVDLAVTGSGEVIFDTRTDARKADNIAFDPRIALVVGWAEGVSIQVEGLADILVGAERAEYGRMYCEQFPGSRALEDELRAGQGGAQVAEVLRREARVVPRRGGHLVTGRRRARAVRPPRARRR